MVKDAGKGKFDVVMVWAIDRLGICCSPCTRQSTILKVQTDVFIEQLNLDTTTRMGKRVHRCAPKSASTQPRSKQKDLPALPADGVRRSEAGPRSLPRPESIFGELRYRAPLLQFVANKRARLRRWQAGFLDLGKERFLAGPDARA
jgi:hypothetical protein